MGLVWGVTSGPGIIFIKKVGNYMYAYPTGTVLLQRTTTTQICRFVHIHQISTTYNIICSRMSSKAVIKCMHSLVKHYVQ